MPTPLRNKTKADVVRAYEKIALASGGPIDALANGLRGAKVRSLEDDYSLEARAHARWAANKQARDGKKVGPTFFSVITRAGEAHNGRFDLLPSGLRAVTYGSTADANATLVPWGDVVHIKAWL